MTTTTTTPRVALHVGTPHVRRVTLNLLRHSAICPPVLRDAIHKLANTYDWDMDAMASAAPDLVEVIYGLSTAHLADQARDEFVADTKSINDYGAAVHSCELCGHQHTRWEFTLKNTAGGRPVHCGSSCIVEYGFNVDGEAAGAKAEKALRAAISRAKRSIERETWQTEHPDHALDFARLGKMRVWLRANRYAPGLMRYLAPGWYTRIGKLSREIGKVERYYHKNDGFLTPAKTRTVYHPGGLLDQCRAVATEMRSAREQRKAAGLVAY